MKKLFFLFILFCQAGYSQSVSITKVSAPDSVKVICDKLFLAEIGSELFNTLIQFDSTGGTKSVYENGEVRLDYILYYTFSYPVKGATFPLTMNYAVYSGKGHLQSGRFLRVDQTDLPENIKKKGNKIIPAEEARKIAIKTDALMINSSYFFILGQDKFYWHFIIYEDDTDLYREMDESISHHVIVDPYNGKVISHYIQ